MSRATTLPGTAAAALLAAACGEDAGAGEGEAGREAESESEEAGIDTRIVKAPEEVSESRSARFEIETEPQGAAVECSLDGAGFAPCESPVETPELRYAAHRFEARAVADGRTDATPAAHAWAVVARADFPDVAVIPAAEDLFASEGSGVRFASPLDMPQQLRTFYDNYSDEYHAVLLFPAFEDAARQPYALPLAGGIEGIGAEGWAERLGGLRQGVSEPPPETIEVVIWMHWIDILRDDPDWPSTYGETVLDLIAEEFGHRWGLSILATDLIDDGPAGHWHMAVGLGANTSLALSSGVRDNGDGTFTSLATRPHTGYSSLDLYVMGLATPEEVPPFFHVRDRSAYRPPLHPWGGPWRPDSLVVQDVSYRGTRVDVTIEDVIAAHGERVPRFGEAGSAFRLAFALVEWPGRPVRDEQVARVDGFRAAWEDAFDRMTRGRGCADTSLRGPRRCLEE